MVKLRLRRRGRKQAPVYDIVAMDSRKTRDGAFLERIGQYNPVGFPSKIEINADRAIYWLKVGAQPTQALRSMLSSQGVLLRMHLEIKGKTPEEIETALVQHKDTVRKRLERLAVKRQTRLSKKKRSAIEAERKAAEEAKAAEAKAKEEAAKAAAAQATEEAAA
jgi:small subunit ribosomal protein S16